MSLVDRFIDRPILATVLSVLIVIAGAIALTRLPISEYPEVVPPSIRIQAMFPGGSPEVVAETVAGPLEQQMTGLEGLLYQSSQSTPDGAMALTLTFAIGSDLEDALVEVQNRISQAQPRLPEEVRRLGITARKSSGDMALVVHLLSPDERYDMLYLSNYSRLRVKDVLAKIPGVGDVAVFGAGDYSMRVWLDPERVAARGLNPGDVIQAIRSQNVQVAAGVLGAPPNEVAADHQLTITARGRLGEESEFGEIVVKSDGQGRVTRLKDVARLELGADSYSLRSLLDNQPAVALAIFQAPGSNAIELSDQVRHRMDELQRDFPAGVAYEVAYDPTVFVRGSIAAVVTTLLEAVVLVVIVVVLFLQSWRASVIPLAAVPVSLIGTFAVMHAFGFSINALSMFGLVLAIGIVVDDAIVVVENVERNIAKGLTPRDATRQAMREVSGPIIATALVLCAVFIPTAFVSGLTGQFYKQFALTIAISTVISAINSLTLSPALAAMLLKGHRDTKDRASRWLDVGFGWLFRPFNRFFAAASRGYVWSVSRVLRAGAIVLVLYVGLVGLTALGFQQTATGYVPAQDKQYLVAIAQLPDGASLDRTEAVVRRMTDVALAQSGVEHVVAFPGLSISGFTRTPNAAVLFINLAPFSQRTAPELGVNGIAGAINQGFASIQDAFTMALPPPPILGLGNTGGFKVQIEDVGSQGLEELYQTTQRVIAAARASPQLNPYSVFSGFTMNVPQVSLAVDRVKAEQQGVAVSDLFATLQAYLGSSYANDFTRFGRSYQVNVQAEAAHRLSVADIGRLKVRNSTGAMVPLSALVTVQESSGPDRVMHYNTFPSAEIMAAPAAGVSTDEARAAMEAILAQELPSGLAYEWTELTYQQLLAGDTALYVFPLCVLLVLLVLAGFYESWSLPMVVILIVPMCLLSALVGVWIMGSDNNIFTQIGLLVLVGLACKNAILIVEFAKAEQDRGVGVIRAALEACRLRLRPILMTSLAFIMGVWPLVTSSGAGAENRIALGVAVFSGMIGVTLFGLVLTPVFYVAIRRLVARRRTVELVLGPAKQPLDPALASP